MDRRTIVAETAAMIGMSANPDAAACAKTMPGGVLSVIDAPVHALGPGVEVRRALPSDRRCMVGPFIFLDDVGPIVLAEGEGLDVRPHPHIGIATLSYIFEGELVHRDSLGTVATARPGDVNLMVAGAGIVHSERTPPAGRRRGGILYGIQVWLALEREREASPPSFEHHPAATIPVAEREGARLTVLTGELDGLRSPVNAVPGALYAVLTLEPGSRFTFTGRQTERAIYLLDDGVTIGEDGATFNRGQLIVLSPEASGMVIASAAGGRVLIIGGEPFPEPRYIQWNFVASSLDSIEEAKITWTEERFGTVPGDEERIPLPAVPAPARSSANGEYRDSGPMISGS